VHIKRLNNAAIGGYSALMPVGTNILSLLRGQSRREVAEEFFLAYGGFVQKDQVLHKINSLVAISPYVSDWLLYLVN